MLLVALMLAPICTMSGTAAAMPGPSAVSEHHAAMPDAGHCAEMVAPEQQEQDCGDADCRMACAGVLAEVHVVAERASVVSAPDKAFVAARSPGLNPAAEPRPPRFA